MSQQAARVPRRVGSQPDPAWRSATADLPTEPRSVPVARRLVRLVLGSWALYDLAAPAELVTSEIVTNGIAASAAVRYPSVRLRLASQPYSLLVSVWDASPARPELRDGAVDAEGGRGLVLVAALAERWGSDPAEDGGKVVWAAIGRCSQQDTRTGSAHPGQDPS
ncbi:MAG TPA: ATP-binding protein [Streptosporangiaceae bacterium]|nr:ATP-binding protein [Streptosporangiaceae bacterium]